MSCDSGVFELCVGEVLAHSYDTSANVTGLNSALSAGVWALDSGASVTLDSQVVSGNEIIATITAVNIGKSQLSCIASYADGQKTKAELTIYVR